MTAPHIVDPAGLLGEALAEALRGGMPDSLGDVDDAIALAHALRDVSESSALAEYEPGLSEWVAEELVQSEGDWEGLMSTESFLIELGGAAAESALQRLDDYMRDVAASTLRRFLDDGQLPGLSSASEMLEQMRGRGGYEDLDGFYELANAVEYEWEMRADEARDLRRGGWSAREVIPDRVEEMMSSLRSGRGDEE